MIAFSSLCQTDTTSKICFPRYVVVGIQKDLIRLDLNDSLLVVKDSIISNRNYKISLKDSIIKSYSNEVYFFKENEKLYELKLQVKDQEYKACKKEARRQKRLKVLAIFGGVGGIVGTIFIMK